MSPIPDARYRRVRTDDSFGRTNFGPDLIQGETYLTVVQEDGDVAVWRDGRWDRGWLIGNFEEVFK